MVKERKERWENIIYGVTEDTPPRAEDYCFEAKYWKIAHYGMLLARMTTIFPLIVSVPLCNVTLKFLPSRSTLNLTWPCCLPKISHIPLIECGGSNIVLVPSCISRGLVCFYACLEPTLCLLCEQAQATLLTGKKWCGADTSHYSWSLPSTQLTYQILTDTWVIPAETRRTAQLSSGQIAHPQTWKSQRNYLCRYLVEQYFRQRDQCVQRPWGESMPAISQVKQGGQFGWSGVSDGGRGRRWNEKRSMVKL